MLAVVENQQQFPIRQGTCDLAHVVGRTHLQTQRCGHDRADVAVTSGGGEVGEPDAVTSMPEFRIAHRNRQPGLARPTHRQHRHEAVLRQQHPNVADVIIASEQPRRRNRQVRMRTDRTQEREPLAAELPDPHRLRHISQTVLAEVDPLDIGRRSDCAGQEHLTAMTGRCDPRREIHDGTEVVATALFGLTQMEPHPDLQPRTRPRHLTQRALDVRRRPDPLRGPLERNRERIARRREHVATVPVDLASNDLVMDPQRR